MDPDKIGATGTIATAIYAWGCLNRGWTSPLDIGVDIACRMGGHRWCGHDNPSSEAVDDDDAPPEPEVSTPVPLRTPPPPAGSRLAAGLPPVEGPPDPQDRDPYETGIAWTRRQLAAGLLEPGEIDQLGAEKLHVHPDTVRRWRRQLGGTRRESDSERTP